MESHSSLCHYHCRSFLRIDKESLVDRCLLGFQDENAGVSVVVVRLDLCNGQDETLSSEIGEGVVELLHLIGVLVVRLVLAYEVDVVRVGVVDEQLRGEGAVVDDVAVTDDGVGAGGYGTNGSTSVHVFLFVALDPLESCSDTHNPKWRA